MNDGSDPSREASACEYPPKTRHAHELELRRSQVDCTCTNVVRSASVRRPTPPDGSEIRETLVRNGDCTRCTQPTVRSSSVEFNAATRFANTEAACPSGCARPVRSTCDEPDQSTAAARPTRGDSGPLTNRPPCDQLCSFSIGGATFVDERA